MVHEGMSANFTDMALANSLSMPRFDGNPHTFKDFHRNALFYCELIGLDDAINGNLV
jgi:hypothetical protein